MQGVKVTPSVVLRKEETVLAHSPLGLVGGHDMSVVFSLLYPDVFLSISWSLDLEMEKASPGNELFKGLLPGGKMKLRI